MAGGPRRTVVALIALVMWLTLANIARSLIVPSGWQLVWNVVIGAIALGIGAFAALDAAELGLARDSIGAGLRLGAAAFALISSIVIVAAIIPASRGIFEDGRTDIDLAGMVLRVAIVIPIGTVVVEELVFRGVLHGLLDRLTTSRRALITGALLFGAWHVLPAWRTASSAGDTPFPVAAGTFLATSAAGVGFTWLRRRSGSVLAPMLAHTATNSVVFALAWAVSR